MAGGLDERTDSGAWTSFTRDLGIAIRAWGRAPFLPLLTVVIGLAQGLLAVRRTGAPAGFMVLFGSQLLFAGWIGTQRIWYLRAWRRKPITPAEIAKFTVRYIWRFVWLALTCTAIFFPFMIVGIALGLGTLVVFLAVLGVAADFLLTFVTPALAYSTASASEALRIGVRMLRETWPRCAWYALVPPLAITSAGLLLPQSTLGTGARGVYVGVSALVALVFKGAAGAFYLRRNDVGDDGSVYMRPRDVSASPA